MDSAVVVNMADEGIPVRAIARTLKVEVGEIYNILKEAVDDGKLIELPKDDWPPHTRMQRLPQFVKTLSEDVKLFSCMNLFKIPRTQAVLLLALLSRPYSPREYLHSALLRSRKAENDQRDTDIKMVDVVLCNLRKRLKPYDVEVETIWGVGYHLPDASRDAVTSALESHVRGITAPQPPTAEQIIEQVSGQGSEQKVAA